MVLESGEDLKLVGGLELFNGYTDTKYQGQVKAAKVTTNLG